MVVGGVTAVLLQSGRQLAPCSNGTVRLGKDFLNEARNKADKATNFLGGAVLCAT